MGPDDPDPRVYSRGQAPELCLHGKGPWRLPPDGEAGCRVREGPAKPADRVRPAPLQVPVHEADGRIFPAVPITEAEVFAILVAHKAITQYLSGQIKTSQR